VPEGFYSLKKKKKDFWTLLNRSSSMEKVGY